MKLEVSLEPQSSFHTVKGKARRSCADLSLLRMRGCHHGAQARAHADLGNWECHDDAVCLAGRWLLSRDRGNEGEKKKGRRVSLDRSG